MAVEKGLTRDGWEATLPPVRRRACLTALVLVAATGCGQEPPEQVRSAVERFASASAQKDYQELCREILAPDLVERVRSVGLPCEAALEVGLGAVREPTLEIVSIEVADDQALARVRTGAAGEQPSEDSIRLVREDGDWRIASLSGPQPQPPEPQGGLEE